MTIDVAIDAFETKTKRFTLIDAPGHRDFIPNMISGAAQADTAVLVIDGSNGGFERGFEGNGQTREHAVLVRSLGVQQLVVAINKLDSVRSASHAGCSGSNLALASQVRWAQARYENIREQLAPFLTQSGFQPSKVFFVPVGATTGENIVERSNEILNSWYSGPTLIEQLGALGHPPSCPKRECLLTALPSFVDVLGVPRRSLEAPLRIPVSNVFRGQTAIASGLAVSGRIESGVVQVGEELAALPGDGTGVVRCSFSCSLSGSCFGKLIDAPFIALEVDGVSVPWAVAGVNATIYLSNIDPRNLRYALPLHSPHPKP